MARPRKQSKPSAYQRRNERAQAAGFKNYYEQRLAKAGGDRSKARGHRGSADMLRAIRPGVTVSLSEPISQVREPVEQRRRVRTKSGAFKMRKGRPVWKTVLVYPRIDKLLILNDGMGVEFVIRNVTRAELVELIEREIARGASYVTAPSFDQRRLVSEEESEGGY